MRPVERASRYEIRVQGALDARWSAWFAGLKICNRAPGETTLTGPLRDQSELHGVLARVRDLGLPLIELRRLDRDPAHAHSSDADHCPPEMVQDVTHEHLPELVRRWADAGIAAKETTMNARRYTDDFRSTVLLRSEQSDGHVAVVEGAAASHWEGPPLHHHDFDEGFYVLEGEITFEVNGERRIARPGEFAFAPRGSHHALANLSDAPARYLLVCTPAGFERYFDRISAEQTGTDPPPEASKPYPHSTIVGPRIGQYEEH